MTDTREALEEKLALSQVAELRRLDRKGREAWNDRKVEIAKIAIAVVKQRYGVELPLLFYTEDADGRLFKINIWAEITEQQGLPTEE